MPALGVIGRGVILWATHSRGKLVSITLVILALSLLFGAFSCWPIVIPTLIIGAAMLAARNGEHARPWRKALWRVTLPEWIMTWFVVIAALLTIIGVFFRGPGWSWVWPWEQFRA